MKDFNEMNLEEYKENIDICIACAACFARGPIVPHNWQALPPPEWQSPDHKCPSYEYFQFRSHTAMGRLILAAKVFKEDFPVDKDLLDVLYSCTACGVCNEICPVATPLYAIAALREEVVRRGGLQPRVLAKVDTHVAGFHNVFGRKKRSRTLNGLPTKGDDVYFAGCEASYRQPDVAKATVEVLKAGGIQVAGLGPEEWCCGFMARWNGNRTLFEEMARHNVEAMKQARAKRVILSCAHGYQTWKVEYPRAVGDLPFEIVHVSEVLVNLLDAGRIRFTQEIDKRITYHDPCFLGRHAQIYEEPRKLLQSIPGLELNEMGRNRRWSYCCGAGGKLTQMSCPEFADQIARDRLREAKEVADTVVTSCPVCVNHMRNTARKADIALDIQDLPILVAAAMGI